MANNFLLRYAAASAIVQCALRPVRAMTAAAVLRRTMVLLLLLLMFSSSSFPSVTAECPDECTCGRVYGVECYNREVDRIPNRIPPATEILDLRTNKIRDIEPLANLTKLYHLDLGNNTITDIKSLAHLTELEKLHLDDNKITDIESLANLTKLYHLDLGNNTITDIKSLANLTNLKILYLENNKITDIESLANLTELKNLHLHNNKITDIKALANLTKLESLHLDNNKITDIESLANLTKLWILDLGNNTITDIKSLAHLTELEKLILDKNNISEVKYGAFANLSKLKSLQLEQNPLTCTCNILLFVNELGVTKRDVLWNNDPKCYFVVEMRIKSLKKISENDFNCTSPDVIVVPENKTVSVGEQLQLSCKAVGDPEPFITWAKDDIDLELGQRVQVFQNNTLIISKVERTDGGQYKCVASNPLGRKSFESMVKVNG